MIDSMPDAREQECPSVEACNGWCDLHQVLSDEDVRRLRILLERLRDRLTIGNGEVLDFVQAIVRERLYEAFEEGFGHAVAAIWDAKYRDYPPTDPSAHRSPEEGPHVNPYAWTRGS